MIGREPVLLSVVIPVFDTESRFLRNMMASFEGCDAASGIEVIIVDDGSRRDVALLLDSLAGEMSISCRVVHEPNRGQNAARILGVSISRGEWIQFLDSDDSLDVVALRSVLDAARVEKSDFVISPFQTVSESGDLVAASAASAATFAVASQDEAILGAGSLWRCLFRRDLFKENLKSSFEALDGISIGEDLAMYVLLAKEAERPLFSPVGYYRYTKREGSVSNSPHQERIFDILAAFDVIVESLKEDDPLREPVEWLAIQHVLYWGSIRLMDWEFYSRNRYLSLFRWMNANFPNWKSNEYCRLGKKSKGAMFRTCLSGVWWIIPMMYKLICRLGLVKKLF